MSTEEAKKQAIRGLWEMSMRSLEAAHRECQARDLHFAINRAYYAVFYAVSAALLEKGRKFKKHSGVQSAFHVEFIKTGQLDSEWGKLYDRLFEDRRQGDYLVFTAFEAEYVQEQIEKTRTFLEVIKPFLSLGGKENP